jgi:hypothetical protein
MVRGLQLRSVPYAVFLRDKPDFAIAVRSRSWTLLLIACVRRERAMSPEKNYEVEIAAFIRTKGITRCPTACAAPTHASGSTADREALRLRAERLEALREERSRHFWANAIRVAA